MSCPLKKLGAYIAIMWNCTTNADSAKLKPPLEVMATGTGTMRRHMTP